MHRDDSPVPGTTFGDNEIVIHKEGDYGTYVDGYHLMAKKVWEDIQAYEGTSGFVKDVSSKHLHRRIPNFH